LSESTFDAIAEIISGVVGIPKERVTPDSNAADDLGVDSLSFLDVAFEIDKRFKIKLPVEQWIDQINKGEQPPDDFFVVRNLCRRVDELTKAGVP
jgi:acyl carrier protein